MGLGSSGTDANPGEDSLLIFSVQDNALIIMPMARRKNGQSRGLLTPSNFSPSSYFRQLAPCATAKMAKVEAIAPITTTTTIVFVFSLFLTRYSGECSPPRSRPIKT